VSNSTLAASSAHAAPVFSSRGADSHSSLERRIAAEQALTNLERAVQRLTERFFAPITLPRRTVPRRSRRSAWLPRD